MFVYVLDKNGQPLMPTSRFDEVVHSQSGCFTNLKQESYMA